jgi:NhaA family Na+:H+ antiporter
VPSNVVASLLLFLMAILAAGVANSGLAPIYEGFLSQELHIQIGQFNLLSHNGHDLTMQQFINDCLMALFFLSVGLEIKRELLVGELSTPRKAALPFIAACGGMILPVLIYLLFVTPDSPETNGMAIPMATDIAFSLGVLSLLGKRVPLSLKIFLTAFAVVDDIGGILVIALFYSSHVAYGYLLVAVALLALLYVLGRYGVVSRLAYFAIGLIIWYLFLQSGIHSTIAGVLIAFVIPARPRLDVGRYIRRIRSAMNTFPVMKEDDIVLNNRQIGILKKVERASDYVISPLQSLEDELHNVVNFLILPLFAFANAGVVFSGDGALVGNVGLAVMLGLLVGKFVGIFSFTWLSVKLRLTAMPDGMNLRSLAGVSLLGGIGFTVSLFIASLSFSGAYPELLNQAKFGVLSGTLIAGTLGYVVLRLALRRGR